jgi:hypothetical protein
VTKRALIGFDFPPAQAQVAVFLHDNNDNNDNTANSIKITAITLVFQERFTLEFAIDSKFY